MNNKYISLLLVLIMSCISAGAAENIKVYATSEFSTANPSKSIDVRIAEESALGSNEFHAGDILHCNVIKITNPKRGKRSAKFAVCPVSYTSDGVTKSIEGNYYGKYADKIISKEELKNIDKVKVGKKAAVTVGNYFVKGVAPAVAMAQGMIKNEDGNRLESGVKEVYRESPLSYVEKGKDLVLESGEDFYFVFKPAKSKDNQELATEAEVDDDVDTDEE